MGFWSQFPALPGLPRFADGQSRVLWQPLDRASAGGENPGGREGFTQSKSIKIHIYSGSTH